MTDRQMVSAGHRALVASGAGNVLLARFVSSAEVTWRRRDRLGVHAELTWRPGVGRVAHLLVTIGAREFSAYAVAD